MSEQEENRIKQLLANFPQEKFVGISGLALLSSATILALSGDPNAALFGGIGSNVLASLAQQHFEQVRDLPTKDESDRLAQFAKRLTSHIRQNDQLRQDIGQLIESYKTLDIAMAMVEEYPVQGWLLSHILNDLRANFDRSFTNQAQMIANQIEILSRLDELPNDDEALQPYLRLVMRRSELLPLAPLDPKGSEQVKIGLEDVFISLKVQDSISYEEIKLQEKTWVGTANAAIAHIEKNARLIILGDAGSGKSTLLRYLAYCLANATVNDALPWLGKLNWQKVYKVKLKGEGEEITRYFADSDDEPQPVNMVWQAPRYIPILVELREFAQTDFDATSSHAIWHYIERALAHEDDLDSAVAALKKRAQNGGLLLMLDGIDEVPNEKRHAVWQAIKALRDGPYGDNRWIATCRVLSFVKEEAPLGVPVQQIQELDQHQIDQFIENWGNALKEQGELNVTDAKTFKESLRDATRTRLADLAPNPMLLTIIVLVQKYHGTLPKERAKLYEACVDTMLLRWQLHKEKGQGKENLTILSQLGIEEKTLEKLLWDIAWQAHYKNPQTSGPADIPRNDLMDILGQDKYFGKDGVRAAKFIRHTEERSHLLIYKGGNGEHIYTFPHRTFQEFLAARYLLTNKKERKQVATLAGMGAPWREVLNLATGYLVYQQKDDERALELIERIVPSEMPEPDDVDSWHRVWLASEMAAIVTAPTFQENEEDPLLMRLRNQLANLLAIGALTPTQRAEAGEAAGLLGEARRDVVCGEPEMVDVPSGMFWMGSNQSEDAQAYGNEEPRHEVVLSAYKIGKYPVTNAQFAVFVHEGGYEEQRFWTEDGWQSKLGNEWAGPRYAQNGRYNHANQPVVGISWFEAVAYCQWLSHKTGRAFRLPSETMWERAARGTNGVIYPWGNEWIPESLNWSGSQINQPSAVGIFPSGASPVGALDMSGNVWEWCSTDSIKKYPVDQYDYGQEIMSKGPKCLRGGASHNNRHHTRAAYRLNLYPLSRSGDIGFRVAEHLSDSDS